jgi:ribosomal protein S18 acetylase RimI-like enzyme
MTGSSQTVNFVRNASVNDIDGLMRIIRNAITDMRSRGIDQWDDIYPTAAIFASDVEAGQLFVWDDGLLKGLVALNEHQEREYAALDWLQQDASALVVHRMCVDPAHQGRGIAKNLLRFAETHARARGYASIRLDAFAENHQANALYIGAGFQKVGNVPFRKGIFHCYEKLLINP